MRRHRCKIALFAADRTDRGSHTLRLVSGDLCVPSVSRHILTPMMISTPIDPLLATRVVQAPGHH
jgi:hypothetical protein